MKQSKALLQKEWNTHWKTILTPVWFTGGFYLIFLVGIIINLFKTGAITIYNATEELPAGFEHLMLYFASSLSTITLGMVAVITAIILADNFQNGGFKRQCEILHLSQPVPLYKILGVKYLLMTLGLILLLGAVSLLNSLIISASASYFSGARFSLGLQGWLQSWIELSVTLVLLSSLFWFFAGLFRRKSFFKGLLVIFGIQIAIEILNWTAGLEIPSLLRYLLDLIAVQVSRDATPALVDSSTLTAVVSARWQHIFTWQILLKLLYSAIFGLGGSWLYRRREVF